MLTVSLTYINHSILIDLQFFKKKIRVHLSVQTTRGGKIKDALELLTILECPLDRKKVCPKYLHVQQEFEDFSI